MICNIPELGGCGPQALVMRPRALIRVQVYIQVLQKRSRKEKLENR